MINDLSINPTSDILPQLVEMPTTLKQDWWIILVWFWSSAIGGGYIICKIDLLSGLNIPYCGGAGIF